jgi:hypothetical protein
MVEMRRIFAIFVVESKRTSTSINFLARESYTIPAEPTIMAILIAISWKVRVCIFTPIKIIIGVIGGIVKRLGLDSFIIMKESFIRDSGVKI